MSRFCFFTAVGYLLLTGFFPVEAIRPEQNVVPGEVLVQVLRGIDLSSMIRMKASKSVSDASPPTFYEATCLTPPEMKARSKSTKGTGASNRRDTGLPNLYLLRGDPSLSSEMLVQNARFLPGVLRAEPNYIGSLSYVPTDPLYLQTADHFARINMEDAWNVQPGGIPEVMVAVIDSGIDPYHTDLDQAIHPASYNFVTMSNLLNDDLDHGTRVAGIIAAEGNNGEGIAGAAFGVRILSCDVVDATAPLTTARTIAALNYAVAQGAKVINMSLSFYAYSRMLEDACRAASQQAVLIASAGNEGQSDSPVYPASYDSVLGVGATELNSDQRALLSNYNGVEKSLVDLVAPGVNIFTTIAGSAYDGSFTTGTSYSTALVSGVAALLQSHYPSQTPLGIVRHLKNTALSVGDWAGSGRLSAKNALETPMLPDLVVAGIEIDDATTIAAVNDLDGAWDKGETVNLIVHLYNRAGDAHAISGFVATSDPDVTIQSANGTWADIPTGVTVAVTTPFRVTAAAGAIAHLATMTLQVTSNSGLNSASIPFYPRIEDSQVLQHASYFTPQTWTSQKTWEIHGQQNFNAGLTVEPGTVVKCAPDAQINIRDGSLRAVGTPQRSILFTALNKIKRNKSTSTTKQDKLTELIPSFDSVGPQEPVGPRTEPVNLSDYSHIIYVSISTGSDATGNGTKAYPYATPNYALSKITDAGFMRRYAVFVAGGEYALSQSVSLKDWIDLYGGFNPTSWERDIDSYVTVLDGLNAIYHVVIGADHSRIDGFTITGGNAIGQSNNYENRGGGILSIQKIITITNNCITENTANGSGGGIYCYEGTTTISNNEISGNAANGSGGGIYCNGGTPTISNNEISGNAANGDGGGISCEYGTPTIMTNEVSGNTSNGSGGGIYCNQGTPTISNNEISGNTAHSSGGIYCSSNNLIASGNKISYNTAQEGGGGTFGGGTVSGNIVLANIAQGDDARTGGLSCNSSQVINNLIVGNKVTARFSARSGGLLCNQSTAEKNIITDNQTVSLRGYSHEWRAGGVFCQSVCGLTDNLIIGNSPEGIYLYQSTSYKLSLDSNLIAGNRRGGVYSEDYSTLQMTNNVVWSNSGPDNGGVRISGNNVLGVFAGNTIVWNSSKSGVPGISSDSPIALTNTIVYDNTGSTSNAKQVNISGSGKVSYCNIQGGYAGDTNIDRPPQLFGAVAFGVIDGMVFDPETYQTELHLTGIPLPTDILKGIPLNINDSVYLVASNSGNKMSVLGDVTRDGTVKPPLDWAWYDFHLRPESPCINAGIGPSQNSNIPGIDIDGEPRQGSICDIGADEFNPDYDARGLLPWGEIYIQNKAKDSLMMLATVEGGTGVRNESPASAFQFCVFQSNAGWGLFSTNDKSEVLACHAFMNLLGGISAPERNLTGCSARLNGGKGLIGKVLSLASAYGNGDVGLTGTSADTCISIFNGGTGVISSGPVANSTAENNRGDGMVATVVKSLSRLNDGWGIIGSSDGCKVLDNETGGVKGSAVGSRVRNNLGTGVEGSTTLLNCEITGNLGPAGTGANQVADSILVNNGAGVSGASTVGKTYIAGNGGGGIDQGAVNNCTVIYNDGKGINAPSTVTKSWVLRNKGIGIDRPKGNVTYTTIQENAGFGIRTILPTAIVNFCNIFGNGVYEYFDDENTASGYYLKDVRFNYWGPTLSLFMLENPFPSIDLPGLYDAFENNLDNGWYADYGAVGEFEIDPIPDAPSALAPAFLIEATPNLDNAANVGLLTFKLIFSESMRPDIQPLVTFDNQFPYTDHVVQPVAWDSTVVADDTWLGSFAVGIETGDGLNTIRVSGAKAVDGFVIPDDTNHQFTIDTRAQLSSPDGTVESPGAGSILLKWRASTDPSLAGYSVRRSESPRGPYLLVATLSPQTTEFLDSNLPPGITYYYQVVEFDTGYNSRQLIAPLKVTTDSEGAPTRTPTLTLTGTTTPTITQTGTFTFSPTPSHTPTMPPPPTLTPTPTLTRTLTATESPTTTGTSTTTATSTDTLTPTSTSSETQTNTDTPSLTPTETITFTVTFTDSATPTATETETPTPSETGSYTATPSVTETETHTPTLTGTVTVTASKTMTETVTSTPQFYFDIDQNGEVDARDLMLLLTGMDSFEEDQKLLFDFAKEWKSKSQ